MEKGSLYIALLEGSFEWTKQNMFFTSSNEEIFMSMSTGVI